MLCRDVTEIGQVFIPPRRSGNVKSNLYEVLSILRHVNFFLLVCINTRRINRVYVVQSYIFFALSFIGL